MKASELMAELLGWSEEKIENTVDTCKAGDPEREVKKVATCFIATPEVIQNAAAWGHETVYGSVPVCHPLQKLIILLRLIRIKNGILPPKNPYGLAYL